MSNRLISALSVLSFLTLWQFSALISSSDLLSSPVQVAQSFRQMIADGELWRAVSQSMARVTIGYVVGICAGIATGLMLGSFRVADKTIGLIFDYVKGIPPIAVVPIVIMWLGIGEISKYVVIAYIVWIVVTISTAVGAREIPAVRLRMGQVMQLGIIDRFRWIIFPSTLPFVISGMRNGLGFAFVGLVSAELIAANSGIGQIIMDARFALETSKMMAGLVTLGVLGALLQVFFDYALERSDRLRRYQV